MAQIEFTLDTGISIDGNAQTACVLCEPNAGQIVAANEESEKVVMVPVMLDDNGAPITEPQLVISPSLVSVHLLRRQIKQIGEIKGPIEIEIFNKLSAKDLETIQGKAAELDQAANNASKVVAQVGRQNRAGEESE